MRIRLLLSACLLSVALSASAAETGLVGYWNFDEGKGDTATDSSGNNNPGKLVREPKWVDGKFGKALSFDAAQRQKVEIANSDSLNAIKTAVTIEAWVNPANFNAWVSFGVKGDIVYGMFINPAAFVRIHYADGQTLDTPGNILKANEWTHVVGTFDGKNARIYINGDVKAEKAAADPIPQNTLSFVIGGTQESRDWYAGMIDEVKLYSRGVTADEVKASMKGPTQAVSPRGKAAVVWGTVKNSRQ